MSLPKIKEKYGIDYKLFQWYLRYLKIEIRSHKEGFFVSSSQRNETNLQKYGHINPLGKNTEPYRAKNKTVLKKYGVNNVFELKEIKRFIVDEAFPLKYGISRKEYIGKKSKEAWASKTIEERQQWNDNALCSKKCHDNNIVRGNHSKLELNVVDVLKNTGLSVVVNFKLKDKCRNRKFYDILLPEFGLIIEVNGDYWHANPGLYKKDDLLRYPGRGFVKVETIWEKDKVKKEIAENKGYKLLYIWEKDIKDLDNQTLQTFLLEKIEKYENNEDSKYKESRNEISPI
jgi:G:T-mismatch repair DNA endonuclease (very short patch repair protein)